MARLLLLQIIMLVSVLAQATTSKELYIDADANRYYGDFYKAFREYSVIEKLKPELFFKIGLEGYLQSLFVIGGNSDITAECRRLATSSNTATAAKAAYLCGLHFVETKEAVEAESILKLINVKSHFFWPAQVLRASAAIEANRPQMALQFLNLREMKQYAKYGLEDTFHLTVARAYAEQNNLEEALKNYQTIGGESMWYVNSLEETAWVFFKMRRFESATVLLDVLIAQYESAQRLNNEQKISSFVYFRSKYLKAYMALVERRTEGAAGEFAELKNEYAGSLEGYLDILDASEAVKNIQTQNEKWTDVHNLPDRLTDQLTLISEWLGADAKLRFEKEIYFQMAITREAHRVRENRDVINKVDPQYEKQITELQTKSWRLFLSQYTGAISKVEKELNMMKIKAELGRMEIGWMKRTEGARSLDEVVDSYRQESRSFDEYIEK